MTPARTASIRASSKLTTIAVTAPLSETRSPRIRSSFIARRRTSCGVCVPPGSISRRTSIPLSPGRVMASTVVAVARLATRSTVSTRSMSPVAWRMKSSVGCENSRSGESALRAMISVRLPPNSSLNRS